MKELTEQFNHRLKIVKDDIKNLIHELTKTKTNLSKLSMSSTTSLSVREIKFIEKTLGTLNRYSEDLSLISSIKEFLIIEEAVKAIKVMIFDLNNEIIPNEIKPPNPGEEPSVAMKNTFNNFTGVATAVGSDVKNLEAFTGVTYELIKTGTATPIEMITEENITKKVIFSPIREGGNYKIIGTYNHSEGNVVEVSNTITFSIDLPSEPKDKRLVGYWSSWGGNGPTSYVDLEDVPAEYDTIVVSFIITDGLDLVTPIFNPEASGQVTDQEFKDKVKKMQEKGHKVVIAVGGATGIFKLNSDTDKNNFVSGVIEIIEKYGFDGYDIDLERESIGGTTGDEYPLMVDATREIVEHFRADNPDFIYSLAPEVAYLITKTYGEFYIKLINEQLDLMSYIHPQYYNARGTGVFKHDNSNTMVATSNDSDMQSDFIEEFTESLILSHDGAGWNQDPAQDFPIPEIPQEKLIIGLPAGGEAAGTGSTDDMEVIKEAWVEIINRGYDVAGFMAWSIDWDEHLNWQFKDMAMECFEMEIEEPIVPPTNNLDPVGDLNWKPLGTERAIDPTLDLLDSTLISASSAHTLSGTYYTPVNLESPYAPDPDIENQRIVAYVPVWKKFNIEDYDFTKTTHVNVSFLEFDKYTQDGRFSKKSHTQVMAQLSKIRKAARDANATISIALGGAIDYGFLWMAEAWSDEFGKTLTEDTWDVHGDASETIHQINKIEVAANNIIKFVEDNGLDGVDLDLECWWEDPAINANPDLPTTYERGGRTRGITNYSESVETGADRAAYGMTLLAKRLRLKRPTMLISTALFATSWYGNNYDGNVSKYLDWVGLMSYDFTGSWNTSPKGAHSSTYTVPDDTYEGQTADSPVYSAVDAANYWSGYTSSWNGNGHMIPREKLVIGVPMYGYDFNALKSDTDQGGNGYHVYTYAEIIGIDPGADISYCLDNNEESYTGKITPGVSNPNGINKGESIYYHTPMAARSKVYFSKENGFQGTLLWEVTQDLPTSHEKSLIGAMDQALNDTDIPVNTSIGYHENNWSSTMNYNYNTSCVHDKFIWTTPVGSQGTEPGTDDSAWIKVGNAYEDVTY